MQLYGLLEIAWKFIQVTALLMAGVGLYITISFAIGYARKKKGK